MMHRYWLGGKGRRLFMHGTAYKAVAELDCASRIWIGDLIKYQEVRDAPQGITAEFESGGLLISILDSDHCSYKVRD